MSSKVIHKYTDPKTGAHARVTVEIDGQQPKIRNDMSELQEASLKLALNMLRNDFRKFEVSRSPAYSQDPEQIRLIKNAVKYYMRLKKGYADIGYKSDTKAKGFYARFRSPRWSQGGVLYKYAQSRQQDIQQVIKDTLAGMNSYTEYVKKKQEGAAAPNE